MSAFSSMVSSPCRCFVCKALVIGLVLLGWPLKPALAQRGGPIRDCNQVRAKQTKWADMVDNQTFQQSMARTKNTLDLARQGSSDAVERAKSQIKKAALREALTLGKDLVKATSFLRGRIGRMREAGMKPAQIKEWLQTMDRIDKLKETLDAGLKLEKAGAAGVEYGNDLQKASRDLTRQLRRANQFLEAAGLAEEVGEALSKLVGGPLGALAFRTAKLGIDLTVSLGEGFIDNQLYRQLTRDYAIMQDQLDRWQGKLDDANLEFFRFCSPEALRRIASEQAPPPIRQPRPPISSPPSPPANQTPKAKSGGVSTALLLGTGLAVLAAAAAATTLSQSGAAGASCPTLCNSGFRFCNTGGFRSCCPTSAPVLCSDNRTCTTLTFASCPPGSRPLAACCPGRTDCKAGC